MQLDIIFCTRSEKHKGRGLLQQFCEGISAREKTNIVLDITSKNCGFLYNSLLPSRNVKF